MTNMEVFKLKIANMTAEELGQFMDNDRCSYCAWYNSHECSNRSCTSGITEWLTHRHVPTVKQVEKQKTVTEIHLMCSCGGEYFEEINTELCTGYKHRCNQCGNVLYYYDDIYPRLKE